MPNDSPPAPDRSLDRSLEKRQTLWILLALFFVAGWFRAFVSEDSNYFPLYQLCFGLGSTIFIVRWVALDAAEFAFKLTVGWIFLFVLFAPLAVPIYLFKTRGKDAWRPILVALGLLLLYGITMGAGESVARAVLGL